MRSGAHVLTRAAMKGREALAKTGTGSQADRFDGLLQQFQKQPERQNTRKFDDVPVPQACLLNMCSFLLKAFNRFNDLSLKTMSIAIA